MVNDRSRAGKRLLDVLLAGAGLLVLAPLMAAVAVAVRLNLGRPVLFRQVRPGYQMRPFELIKFRTMTTATGPDGNPLPDGKRLTRLGRFLRSFSLDELPQLWNVLRGDLSLVGPRPLVMQYLPYFTAEERKRFTVRPGITGWAQIRGRHLSSWDARLADDIWYVDHWSLWLDCRILVLTPLQVLARRGTVADQTAVLCSQLQSSPAAARPRGSVADQTAVLQGLDRERAALGPAKCE